MTAFKENFSLGSFACSNFHKVNTGALLLKIFKYNYVHYAHLYKEDKWHFSGKIPHKLYSAEPLV